MSDSPLPAPPVARTHVSWGVEVGRLRVAVTRTRETTGSVAARGGWPFASGALAGMGAVALLVVGASAAPPAVPPARYMVSLPVPAAAPPHLARPAVRVASRRVHAKRTPAAASFDPADEPYVESAMATGAFQEWEDSLGQHRFLTAGPARIEGGRACRSMALLVRLAEGGSRVRSAERCTTGPVSDTATADAEPVEG